MFFYEKSNFLRNNMKIIPKVEGGEQIGRIYSSTITTMIGV